MSLCYGKPGFKIALSEELVNGTAVGDVTFLVCKLHLARIIRKDVIKVCPDNLFQGSIGRGLIFGTNPGSDIGHGTNHPHAAFSHPFGDPLGEIAFFQGIGGGGKDQLVV